MGKVSKVHVCVFGTLRQKLIESCYDADVASSCRIMSFSNIVYAIWSGNFHMLDFPGYSIHKYRVFTTFDVCVETLFIYAAFRKQLAAC